MPHIIYQEFREQFANTKYPFEDSASMGNATLTLPESLFLDATIYLEQPYLSGIQVAETEVVLTVSASSETLTGTPDSDIIYLYAPSGRVGGCIVSEKDRLSWLYALPTGTYTFYPEETTFAARCCMPVQIAGVASMGISGNTLTGDVWLVGADGVFIRYLDGKVRFDILGEVLYKRKQCGSGMTTPRYLQTINGNYPDIYGGMQITARLPDTKAALRVITDSNTIELNRLN